MKSLFALVFICFYFVSNAQTTTISDTNFEQFLVDQGIDTNGVNGNILNSDATAVTGLNLNRNDIADFTGLEAFVNVTTLNLGNNLFTDLPLNNLVLLEELVFNNNTVLANLDLSANVNLKIIDMRANGGANAAPITTIDFSANINLTSIHIYNFGALENFILPNTTTLNNLNIYSRHNLTVDLGAFDSLETLSLGVGASRVINVTLPTVKTSLTYFRLFNGAIPTIDLSSFVALETIDFTGTGVVTFIPPQTPTLTDVKIQIHNISTVSFNGAPNLKNLTIRNGNPTSLQFLDITDNLLLETLTLVNNKMTNVDITKNTELISLDISDNDLTTINTEQNDKLVSLNAKENLITNLDLSTNILLKSILLGENKLPNLDVTANILLEDLEIDNNLFTTTGLDLTQNTELEDFTASFNQIESLDISQNSKLKKLIIDNNLFSGNDILKEYYQNFINSGRFISGSYELIVHHNNLTGLIPDFSTIVNNNTHRFILEIDDNNFHFEDFEAVHDQYLYFLNNHSPNYSNSFFNYFRSYNYAGQDKVNPIENPTPNAGDDITLTTTVRGSQNHYKWYKNGVEIIDAPDAPEYTITDLNTCDNGVYYSEITSDLIPFENSNPPGTNGKNLLLIRNDITLTVNTTKECVTLDMPLTNVPINSGVQWNDTPGACGYKISVGTTSGATDVVNNEDVRDVTVYNFDSDLDPNEDYFVTITPYYDDGDFTCTEQSFSTNSSTISPDCTSLSSPFNIESNVATDLSRIEWNPANGADEYNITISSPSSANDITTNTTETFLTLSNDFNTGEIVTVTIVPENNIGSAPGCTPETFTITNTSIIIPSGNPFITTWKTDNSGALDDDTIIIPTISYLATTYNYTVDWGDGTITTGETGEAIHTYTTPGTYSVSITGLFPGIWNGKPTANPKKLVSIEQWGDNPWDYFDQAFKGCTNMAGNFTDTPNLSNVPSLSGMFEDCISYNSDMNDWDTSNITLMNNTFRGATTFNGAIENWDMSNVTKMTGMFERALAFNRNIGNWNTSSLIDMSTMFFFAEAFNQNINFKPGQGFPSGDAWNTSNVTNMRRAFYNAENFNLPIGDWNTENVETMAGLFSGASSFNQDIGSWNVSKVKTMGQMFVGASIFNQDIGGWLVGNVENFSSMFVDAVAFDQDLGSWNIENVTSANSMFRGVTLSTANYDALLIGWNARDLQPNVSFSGGNSQYCEGESARTNMINSDFWTITDRGITGPTVTDLANQTHVDSYTLPTITGTQLTGSEAYYTETDGGGTSYDAGDVINFTDFTSYPVTLYIYDGTGSCANEKSFELTLTENTTPTTPACATLATPMNGATNVVTTLDQITWDAIANAIAYKVTITGTTNNNRPEFETTDTHVDFTMPFLNDEVVSVSIIPVNGTVEATGCTIQSFTIEAVNTTPTIPDCATLATPMNGATNVVTTLNQITWGSVANATAYKVTISGTTNNNRPEFETADTHVDFTMPFLNDEVVSVSIIPVNGTVEATGCTIQSFTIEAANTTPTVPDCAQLTSPANGATGISVNRASVSWNPVANADGYRITISGTADNNVSNFDVTTGNSYNFTSDFTHEEIVNVKIEPYNSAGVNTTCNAQSFTIIEFPTTTPLCTSANSPANGATNIPIDITSVSWPPVTNASGYRITVAGTANNNVSDIDVPRGTTYTFQNNFSYGEIVDINIVPYNAFGSPLFNCPSTNFTIVPDPNTSISIPDCTSLSSPMNGATNVPTNIASVSWDPITNADGYRITITGTTNNDIINIDVASGNSYNFINEFTNEETVNIKIVPYNAAGSHTRCATESFTIVAATPSVPYCTLLSTPTNEATNVATNTTIEWENVDNADGYFLEIITVAGDVLLEKQDVSILTSYTPPNLFPENTEIIVRVTPYSNDLGEATNCSENIFRTSASQKYNVKHGFSPDGDGINDYWVIEGIENHPNNIVSIYNRWGDMVFQVQGYNNTSTVFSGIANQKTKMGANILPEGTYFYKFIISEPHNFNTLQGYVVIKR